MMRAAIALVLAAGLAARAGADQRPMTLKDVAETKSVTAAEIAPGGDRVAYLLSVPRNPLQGSNGPAWSELHVADREGRSRPYVAGEVNVSHARWLPDGSGIAFIARRGADEHDSLYTIPVAGGEARKVLKHASDIKGFAYRAAGDTLAFLAAEPLPKSRKESQDKGFNQEVYEEDTRAARVWIASADGSGSPRVLDLKGSASAVDWSPTAQQLAAVLAPTPLVDDSYMFKRVHVVDADTGQVVQEIRNPGKLGTVAWSPDGQRLAMISGADLHDPAEGRLMITDVPGDGSVRDLLPGYEAHVTSFAWQPDGSLIWTAAEGSLTTVGRVEMGGKWERLHGPGQPIAGDLTLSRDGNPAVVVGESPSHPGEVFLWDRRAGPPQRITHSNPWLESVRLGRQEVLTWKARDGLELDGILVYPLDYDAGRRYPLILLVHGGPEAHVSDGWVTGYSRPSHVAAAKGFAVFHPNYRGSTGRGVEFSKLGHADAAGAEFDDLVDAVDHLVAMGLVDQERVGITGGSYGGYATAWASTYYSERFAAGVMFVGISDCLSKMGTTDIPEEMYLVHHRKRLWEDWEYFLDRSPIRYVQRHRTPLLILHGKEDPRVDPSQSKELYRHLKTLDQAPVRLVLYPGEGHGNRRAAARFDYSVRLMRWMEHYLQGPGGEPPPWEIDHATEYGVDQAE